MSNSDRYADFFRRCTLVARADIFGTNDPIPKHLQDDAHTMFAGYVGPRYRPGGTVIMAVNPGGGGDAYVRRTAQDEIFFPLLQAYKSSSGDQAALAFERINGRFANSILPNWNLWRIFGPVLDAAGAELDDIAFLNAVPYRTRGDREPAAAARAAAWRLGAGPTRDVLRPRLVIALGKKVHHIIERHHKGPARVICVPRTIGDTYISAEAGEALEAIRRISG